MMIATIIAAAAFVQPVTSQPPRAPQQTMEQIMRRIFGRECRIVEGQGAVPMFTSLKECARRDGPVYGRGMTISFPSNHPQAL